MSPFKKKVRVSVPASTSNLGPGYDVLGLALGLHNEVEVSMEKDGGRFSSARAVSRKEKVKIEIRENGMDALPTDERNIVWQSMKKVFQIRRFPHRHFKFQLKLTNRIPLARGLGSSATAHLGGILAANALCGNFLSTEKVLNLAAEMEGHPDNVAPSLLGGFCICAHSGGNVHYIRLDPPRNISAVVCIPDFELSTQKARAVLPKKIAFQDAAYNVSRVSLLLGSLVKRDYSFLKMAMEDRLHQNYRKKLIPGFEAVMKNGYRAGALGIALSGSGPAIFAFAPKSKAGFVGREMEKGFLRAGYGAESVVLEFNLKGSEISCH